MWAETSGGRDCLHAVCDHLRAKTGIYVYLKQVTLSLYSHPHPMSLFSLPLGSRFAKPQNSATAQQRGAAGVSNRMMWSDKGASGNNNSHIPRV